VGEIEKLDNRVVAATQYSMTLESSP